MSERLALSPAPRTRRVPYFLDISHLELVEDVLKETNFNNEECDKLRQELGVYHWNIYSENSLNLKECLREWLSPDTSSSFLRTHDDPLPTLYDLAEALKRIGYIEAGEYIIKTYNISPAYHILWNNRYRLLGIKLPDSSVQLLHTKGLITYVRSRRMTRSSSGYSLSQDDLIEIRAAVDNDHNKLRDFAEILLLLSDTSSLAIDLLKEYYKLYPDTISTTSNPTPSVMRINVSEAYREEFEVFISEYQKLCESIIDLVVDNVPTGRLNAYCRHNHLDVMSRLTGTVSSSDIMKEIVEKCSIIYIIPLKGVIDHYNITAGERMIEDYQHSLDEYLSKLRVRYLLGSSKDIIVNAEEIIFILDWTPDKASFFSIKRLLHKALTHHLNKKIIVQATESVQDSEKEVKLLKEKITKLEEELREKTRENELLIESVETLQVKTVKGSDDVNTHCDIEDKEPQATTKTYDKEVQFNYLVPSEDNLDGLSDSHIAGKKLFLVQGDKPQLMDWEVYGLRISVPEGSLSSSETTELAVIALVGGHFKFPKNTRLVSAVYAISASHLLQSLKLEVQHCIDLSDPSLCKYLKFAVAPVHTSSLPYQFNIVEGGEFPANSRYGSIERSKFCLLCIVGEEKNGEEGNGEQSGGQEQNNGVQQEQSNGHGDSGDEESSGDEGKGGGGNQQGGSGQQQQGGGAEQQGGGGGGESGGQEQLQESHREEENERQQTKGGEVHQKRGKEQQQHESEQLTQEEKEDSNDKENSDSDDVIKAPEVCTESDQSTQSTIIVPDHSTGIPEATVYAGQVFYERKNFMRFTAAKDLNALRKYIKNEYCHSEIDEGFTFKLDPSLGYVELIFNSPQEEPTTGWSVYPHIKPCRINERDMVGFEGISNTHPPSRRVTIDVQEDNPTTVRMLNYSIPLKGALDHTDMY